MTLFLSFLLSITPVGEEDKIVFIYNNYHDDMIRFARFELKILGDPGYFHDAEDVVQEAFFKITKSAKKIDMDNNVKSYAFTTIVHEAYNFMSKKGRPNIAASCGDIRHHGPYHDDFIETIDLQDNRVIKAIGRLKDIYLVTFICRFLKKMTAEEIADQFDIPVKTVYTRLQRGKECLMKLLEEEGVIGCIKK